MTTHVTLNVFSGRPNPTWLLDDKGESELAERLDSSKQFTDKRPVGTYGGLGYRGFSLSRDPEHPQGAMSMLVHEGILDVQIGGTNAIVGTELESWLLKTSPQTVPPDVVRHVESSIALASVLSLPIGIRPECPICHAVDAPPYNPGLWNIPSVQPHNNCYNYANNQITNTFAQPGRATGHPYIPPPTCANVEPASHSDGLVTAPNFTAPLAAGHGWYVALVIWPNTDYHWYRQDKVGCWSHKPGQSAARDVDNAGHKIVDPQACNRGPYTVFCTYMVTKGTVHIR